MAGIHKMGKFSGSKSTLVQAKEINVFLDYTPKFFHEINILIRRVLLKSGHISTDSRLICFDKFKILLALEVF